MRVKHKLPLAKKLFCLALIFLISINSFAAVVADNDGSAFVTKAEFDALKDNFNKQIDDYNASIDGKIDGAIAQYLAGVRTSTKLDIAPYVTNYNTIRWQTGPYWYMTKRQWKKLQDTTAAGHTDTTGWQIFTFKNYRNHNDAYWFSYDAGRSAYAGTLIAYQLWMIDRQSDFCNNYGSTGVSVPFLSLKTFDDGAIGWAPGFTLSAEFATYDRLTPKTHGGNGLDNSQWIYTTAIGTLNLGSVALDAGDILAYKITGFKNNSGGDMTWTSHIKSKEVKFPYSNIQATNYFWNALHSQMWNSGTGNGKTAPTDGVANLPLEFKWNTEAQFKSDMANADLMMLGTDITNEVNYGCDPITDQNGTFYDLSGSGNATNPINVTMKNVKASRITGYNNNNNINVVNNQVNMQLKIPLWYRQGWNTIHNGNFIYDKKGATLTLGGGMPILISATENGTLKIDFDFKEYSDAKDVSVTPDNKIKTYFKNKEFNDSTGTYYSGKVNGSTTVEVLNGTTWTASSSGTGHVSVVIEVKTNSDVWLRVNPDSTNGVYCTINNLRVTFEHE